MLTSWEYMSLESCYLTLLMESSPLMSLRHKCDQRTVTRWAAHTTLCFLLVPTVVVSFGLRETLAENDALPYVQQENVVITQAHGIAVTMDVFTPKKSGNGLGIIDVASGAWHSDRGKIRDHKLAQIYNVFCERGYTIFAVRPGSVTRFSAMDMVKNLEAAIVEIKKQAGQHKIDPDRLGIVGASAGGHLASLVALRQKSGIVAAGVFFPPTDLIEYGDKNVDLASKEEIALYARALAFRNLTSQLTPEEFTEGLTAISPARVVTEGAPPFLLFHGDADDKVPLSQSQKLVEALKAKNVPAELVVKKGGGHPWLTLPVEVRQLADWFDKQYALAQ